MFAFVSQRRNDGQSEQNKKNQMPTGEGKKQSPRLGESMEMNKRSEVMQAQALPGRSEYGHV